MTTEERRQYFRVNKDLSLTFHLVSADTVNNERALDQFPEQQATIEMFDELRRIEREAQQLLSALGDQQRPLADWMKLLNRKVDLVLHHALNSNPNRQENRNRVNLSEGGISFVHGKPIYKGSYVALRLLFTKDFSNVTCFGMVNRCETLKSDQGYKIACEFLSLSLADQELLGRHIMRTQLANKRRQSQQSISG